MRRRRICSILVIVFLVALAGCSGFGGPGDAGDEAMDASAGNGNGDGGDGDLAEPQADAERAEDGDAELLVRQRQLVRTGEIRLRVNDTDAASAELRELVDERGGFVGARNRQVNERYNETWRTETVVVRVPSEEFDGTVAEIERLGEVQEAETRTEDVTDRLVDIEARLENLRAERDRLRELYESANETEDVLAVQRELSDVQEEIERLEAQQASLERDVALSTITVHLAEERPEQPEPEPAEAWYETGVITAFLESIDGVATTIRALVVAGAYVAPYALVFGLPVLGIGVVLRRYRAG